LSELGFAGTPTSDVNAAWSVHRRLLAEHGAPLQAGDQYNLACSGPINTPGVTPLFRLIPCKQCTIFQLRGGPVNGFGDETTALANLDYWGSDFNGIGGIAGQRGRPTAKACYARNNYPSVL